MGQRSTPPVRQPSGTPQDDHETSMTRSSLEYYIAFFAIAAVAAGAWLIPGANDIPGLLILGVVVLLGLTLKARAGMMAILLGALGMVLIRPLASALADITRIALFCLFGGAVVALRYGRARALEATTQYRLLFDQHPLPMWVYDEKTLAFVAVNQAAIDKYGYSGAEFERLTLNDIRGVEEPQSELRPVQESAQYAGTWRHRTKDGKVLEMLVRSNAMVRVGRKVRLALLEDMTERTSLEAQLRQSQKMEAVGQLAGGIAHDFNNILTAILGYATVVGERFPPGDPQRADVDEITKAATRAAGLTRQLLAFSRKQIFEVHVLSMGEVVQEIAPMLDRLVDETIAVTTITTDRQRIKADRVQLQQVLMNLVVNARDAITGAGHITIETADVELDGTYAREHPSAQAGPHVMLAVSDTGQGMDAATQARIFEPFFTTKALGSGTGLGLSTVYGIVKQSGGHIWVYSEVGRGTAFKVYLPATQEPTVTHAPRAVSAAAPATASVLLVEDEVGLRTLVSRILIKAGFTVHAPETPRDAVAWAERCDSAIDLLLTDVVLPEILGPAVAAAVQRHHPKCKVLFISGYTNEAIVRHGALDEDAAFLPKPFTASALLQKIADVLSPA
jgi:two-component system, cell cycle sensor histidine kinase and response regulator CckA